MDETFDRNTIGQVDYFDIRIPYKGTDLIVSSECLKEKTEFLEKLNDYEVKKITTIDYSNESILEVRFYKYTAFGKLRKGNIYLIKKDKNLLDLIRFNLIEELDSIYEPYFKAP